MTLGQELREGRARAKMSLRDVERKTGISNGYLSQLESDMVKRPSPVHLHQLATTYDLDYGHLMELAGYVPVDLPQSQPSAMVRGLIAGAEDLTTTERRRVEEYVELIKAARAKQKG